MFKKPLFWILIVIILAGAGGGYYYYRQSTTTAEAASATPLQTATVKRGNLVISASGTGSVISENEIQLGFEYSGVLAQLNVAVGDEVKQGDVLAISAPSDDACYHPVQADFSQAISFTSPAEFGQLIDFCQLLT